MDAEALADLGLSAADPDSDGLTGLLELFGLDPWDGCDAPRGSGVAGATLRTPVEGLGEYEAYLRREAEALILDSLADSTARSYNSAWEKWLLFCRLRNRQPFLEGLTQAERAQDEDELLLFMVHEAVTLRHAPGTVLQRMFAIRQTHLAAGYADPLEGANGSCWP